jgi:hypothetical protein
MRHARGGFVDTVAVRSKRTLCTLSPCRRAVFVGDKVSLSAGELLLRFALWWRTQHPQLGCRLLNLTLFVAVGTRPRTDERGKRRANLGLACKEKWVGAKLQTELVFG